MSNTYLNRTTGTSPTSRQKFTFSAWFKLSGTSGNRSIFCIEIDGNTTLFFMVKNGDQLHFVDYNSSAEQAKLTTNALYRDPSAWMHVVLRLDSTQGTNTNRCRLYVNGEQITSFSATVYPSQNYNFTNNVGNTRIGVSQGAANYWDGSMSHVHFIDGTAYAPTEFGEYDANGVWKIKTSPSVTYGTNGFFILKDGNSVTDQSPNTNNFTVAGGTLTKTEDNPSNVFAVLNTLDKNISNITLSNGNLTMTTSAINYGVRATMGVSSGKWYWEVKVVNKATLPSFGIAKSDWDLRYPGNTSTSIGYASNGEIYSAGNNEGAYGAAYTTGDIIGVALDMDSLTLTFYKNGVSQGAVSSVFTASDFIFPAFAGQTSDVLSINFGNGYFGTTAVASAGTNASGNGIFEFDVPTGYTALSTKGYNL